MAQVKKISDLNEKTSVNDNDIFLMVDSQATGYPLSKKVKASTIKNYVVGGSPNLLVYDLSQFQSNAGVVYPAGTIIYYRRNNGQVTGVYKISDGVTTLGNLPLFADNYIIQQDDYAYITKDQCLFDTIYNNYNNTGKQLGLNSKLIGKNVSISTGLTNLQYGILVPIWKPIMVYGIGLPVQSVTTAGDIQMAIYTPNATYDVWTQVSGSASGNILINAAGIFVYQYVTPFTLDVGLYMIYANIPSTTNYKGYYIAGVNGTPFEINKYGIRYTNSVRTQFYVVGGSGVVPATINSQLNWTFDNIYLFYLLYLPAI